MGYLTVTAAQYSLELNTPAILRHSIQSKLIRILDECQDLSGNWEEMIYLQFSGSEELNARKQCAINLHKRGRSRSDLTGRVPSLDFRFKWTFTLHLVTGPYMSFVKAGRTWKLHPVTCWTGCHLWFSPTLGACNKYSCQAPSASRDLIASARQVLPHTAD